MLTYLYADLSEKVYLSLPPRFEKEYRKDKVLKLKRSIYDLLQSGRNWYLKFKNALIQISLKPLTSENCVFIAGSRGVHCYFNLH